MTLMDKVHAGGHSDRGTLIPITSAPKALNNKNDIGIDRSSGCSNYQTERCLSLIALLLRYASDCRALLKIPYITSCTCFI